jgi:RNA polymerase sigma-B factor
MTPYRHADAVAPRDWPACDQKTLFSRCAAGDARARETIIVRYLPLARRLARAYEGRGEPIEDLCQAASVGLIRAVDLYSPDRGDAFAAYARPMILGAIRRHFRDTTWRLHVPRPLKERAGRVLRADKALRPSSEAIPEPAAIAACLDMAPEQVTEARRALEAYFPRSLDASSHTSHRDREQALSEVVGGEDTEYERVEVSVGVRRALGELEPRDQKVLLLRLAGDLSQYEIAGRVGVSQMHVSRILRRAGAALTASCGLAVSP